MIAIVSGYFATFHEGHKQYLQSAINENPTELIVIVQDNKLQIEKYGINYVQVYTIVNKIQQWYNSLTNINTKLCIRINHEKSVAKELYEIKKIYKDECVIFMKDGDRDLNNLPQEELNVMKENNIGYKFLGNKKIMSSSEILKIKS